MNRIIGALAFALSVVILSGIVAFAVSTRVVRRAQSESIPDAGLSLNEDAGVIVDAGAPLTEGEAKMEAHRKALALSGSKAVGQIEVSYFFGETIDYSWGLPKIVPGFFGEVHNISKNRQFQLVGVDVFFLDEHGRAVLEGKYYPVDDNQTTCAFRQSRPSPIADPCFLMGKDGIRRFLLNVVDTSKWSPGRVEVYVTEARAQ